MSTLTFASLPLRLLPLDFGVEVADALLVLFIALSMLSMREDNVLNSANILAKSVLTVTGTVSTH